MIAVVFFSYFHSYNIIVIVRLILRRYPALQSEDHGTLLRMLLVVNTQIRTPGGIANDRKPNRNMSNTNIVRRKFEIKLDQ